MYNNRFRNASTAGNSLIQGPPGRVWDGDGDGDVQHREAQAVDLIKSWQLDIILCATSSDSPKVDW
jgi:hypothetical protein